MDTVKAQNSHSLDFNGQSDYIEVTDASATIANSDQISITGWVYPRNTNSGWPDFDGFFGFRNEFDADFYLLQLDNYKVEGRLRISVNDYFTVVTDPNSISAETWYHLALVYDGTNLIVYINGTEAGSTAASGQITNEFVPLYVGRLVFQTTNFDLDGQADEVGLWSLALTSEQIQDYMYADLTGEEGLVGYWNFNEGSGDIANDVSGNNNDGLIYGANWSANIPFQGIYISDQQIEEDEDLNMDLSYLGETMTFEAYSDTSAVSAVINGQSLLLTPLPNWYGISTITVYMTDDSNLLDTASFVLTVASVNDPPTIAVVDDVTMEEDGSASVFLNVRDIDSDDLIYNFYSNPPIFVFTLIDDSLFISPLLNWNGQANLTIFVSDGEDSDNTSLAITVTPVNDAPSEFELISPTVLDTFQVNTATDETIPFTWEPSVDVDSGVVYKIIVTLNHFGTVYTNEYTNIPYTITGLSGYVYAILMTNLNIPRWNMEYVIEASDEEFTIVSEQGEFVLENTSLSIDGEIVPEVFALHQNYPNPFNPTTQIRYDLPEESYVSIAIYDLMGRRVKSLVNTNQAAGYRSIHWNATNDLGQPVSAGMYIYTIQAGEFRQTKKMVLLK